jgi:hypothetical protein
MPPRHDEKKGGESASRCCVAAREAKAKIVGLDYVVGD